MTKFFNRSASYTFNLCRSEWTSEDGEDAGDSSDEPDGVPPSTGMGQSGLSIEPESPLKNGVHHNLCFVCKYP